MKLNNFKEWLVIGGVALSLVGCATNSSKSSSMNADKNSTYAAALTDRARFYGENVTADQERTLQATNTLYFGFDRYDISDENRRVLYAHAKKMMEDPTLTITIAGHADRRGSRAYNLALGERRANAAKQVLRLKGIPETRIKTVSYGKEKPADLGEGEVSFSKNRRDNISYEN